ncbi:polysaccharide biosynthesis protein [Pseudomonas putida]|uniref:polysaccharide biosynthesis/export family protein n=1 Tax=Pseudomonas TaxID=286 RepID=UPI00105A8A4B|nr:MULTISPECIES: polysaccharide biosynthesis/export family protein [Pseudomonas]MBF8745243.1 polysaccharide biosynthesis/export family protein [Pseudomonas monteilii]MCT8163376.1 polysaccharide biosynthesis/export family protein [Pseudomonas sp. HD6422]MCT8182284.1 polysaccharide biosynthesis/export family protein [Pseudomonas sp. HD6421]TDJ79291.1 polysaccharide biosynthesis protein [Pseudomonas putida]
MRYPSIALCLLALGGCASQQTREMPVQILTAPAAESQATEVAKREQVLRPQDVLEVIFHIPNSSSGVYRIQSGDTVDLNFMAASGLNGSQLVQPDGTITLPSTNSAVRVEGLTTADAETAIREAYRNKRVFQNNRDQVTVRVLSPMTSEVQLKNTLTHPGTGMSRDITVGSDGRATFPEIGSVPLQGMTVNQLRDYLNERYASLPGRMTVDVLLKSTAGNEIYVLGEVGQPGAFPIRRPVSVLEALTLARGPTLKAKLGSVVIMRREGNTVHAVNYDVDKALAGGSQNLAYLQPEDMLYVPKTTLASAAELSRQLADVVLFQGWGFSFSYRVDDKDSDN